MNIFQVLSQGKSRLHEPSMSAMLGYLLDSNEDHGLGDAFIRIFLTRLDENRFADVLCKKFVNSQVGLEEPYSFKNSYRAIDIEITLVNQNGQVVHRLVIENKIKVGAANPKQLNEYYQAILQDNEDLQKISMIFLTPYSKSSVALTSEYDNLILDAAHSKYWTYWDAKETFSVVSIVQDLLQMESRGEINPVNEYIRHTLKAFIRHIFNVIPPLTDRTMRRGEDIGDVVEEVIIETKNGKYQVLRRDSTQIQVFNIESGDKVVARNILAEFSDENGLNIPYRKLNTRQIGKKFFEWFSHKNNK